MVYIGDKKSEKMMLLRGIKVGIRYIKEKKRNGRSQKTRKRAIHVPIYKAIRKQLHPSQ
jgi:hypothetical protein